MGWDFGEERDKASTSALANQAIGGEYPPSSALRLTRVSALSLQDFGTRYWDLTCSLTSNTLDKQVWLAKCKTQDPGPLSGTMPKENHLVRGAGRIEHREHRAAKLGDDSAEAH